MTKMLLHPALHALVIGMSQYSLLSRTWNGRMAEWLKCLNKGNFFVEMTGTQRSESANNMLKNMVSTNSSINRFVENLNKLLYILDILKTSNVLRIHN